MARSALFRSVLLTDALLEPGPSPSEGVRVGGVGLPADVLCRDAYSPQVWSLRTCEQPEAVWFYSKESKIEGPVVCQAEWDSVSRVVAPVVFYWADVGSVD